MKHSPAVIVIMSVIALSACDSGRGAATKESAETSGLNRTSTAASAKPDTATSAQSPSRPGVGPKIVVDDDGTPTFAALYPGAALEDAPVAAQGQDGKGGLVSFQTADTPETVVAFYRQKAEAAGLASVTSMNQGEARAYGAAASSGGASLQVVASPSGTGQTSVQLSWSAGR